MIKLLHITVFVLLSLGLSSQCSILFPEDILPETTTSINLSVLNLDADQLGADNGVCAVYLEFEHGRLENLRMNLISPAGEIITLVGPGTQAGAFTSNINWNVTFLPCIVLATPDAGFSSEWNNQQQWLSFNNYTGAYYPHFGCMDFLIGSATGDWTLEIINQGTNTGKLIYFEIEFCDPTGIDCDSCNPVAGSFEEDFVLVCEGDSYFNAFAPSFDQAPSVGSNEFLTFAIEGSAGLGFEQQLDRLDELTAGTYTICAVVADTLLAAEIIASTSISELDLLNDENGCMDITTPCVTLEVRGIMQLEQMPMILCSGDTITFDGENYTSPIDTIIYPDDQGLLPCERATHLVITETIIESEIRMPNSALLCGQPILLDAGASSTTGSGLSYNWSTSDGNIISGIGPIAQVDARGQYFLELESDGCIVQDSIVVSGSTDLELSLTVRDRLCAADSFEVMIRTLAGLPDGFDFKVEELSTVSGTQNIDSISADILLIKDKGEYYISSSYGACTSRDTITLEDNLEPLSFSAIVLDTLSCDGLGVEITVSSSDPDLSYNFVGPETVLESPSSITVQTAGFYEITASDLNLCTALLAVEVIADADFPIVEVDTVFQDCDKVTDIMLDASVTGQLDSIVWIGPTGEKYYGQGTLVSEPGNYLITAYGSNGCNTTETLVYQIVERAVIIENFNTFLECSDHSFMLDGDFDNFNESSIIWSDSVVDSFSSEISITIMEEGEYTVTAVDDRSCIAIRNYLVEDRSEDLGLETLTLISMDDDCIGAVLVWLEGDISGLATVLINGEDRGVSNVYTLARSSYSFLITDNNGCEKELSIDVSSSSGLSFDLGPDVTLSQGESYQIPGTSTAPGIGWTYSWSNEAILSCTDCLDPVVTATESTLLILEIQDAEGCTYRDSLDINILVSEPDSAGFYIPTVFSQSDLSQDGSWTIGLDPSLIAALHVRIYDRWGNLIAEKNTLVDNNFIEVWDGLRGGKPLNIGVYSYMAEFLYMTGGRHIAYGHITLLR